MHIYTGKAKTPPLWEEFGWEAPAPYLPSLEIEPTSCTIEEFAQKGIIPACNNSLWRTYGGSM